MRETLKVFRTQPETIQGYLHPLPVRAICMIETFRV
jgi:hypothetical protein